MPILKIFMPHAVAPQTAEALASELEALCINLLKAQPAAVQIALAQATMLRGAAILVEAHYRAQSFRDAALLEDFMERVESAVRRHLHASPRIRCFAVDQAGLSARN